ncbi:hypothetical protein ACFWIJ_02790 [Streptomyces sp. NPDC127079]|uniref:hypothetical protein n=1 Tax=Streptomyces sp. NPDC127079 TaxID=3347132 RepID=UPI00364FAE2C
MAAASAPPWSMHATGATPAAAKTGASLRHARYGKCCKKIGNRVGPSTRPAGTGKDPSDHLDDVGVAAAYVKATAKAPLGGVRYHHQDSLAARHRTGARSTRRRRSPRCGPSAPRNSSYSTR